MTIEVRQLVIRAQVGVRPNAGAASGAVQGAALTPAAAREIERAKAQILAECKVWLREQLAARGDR